VSDNVVVRWDAAALQAFAIPHGPPMVARALALAHTCNVRRLGSVRQEERWPRGWGANCGDPRQNAHCQTRMKRSAFAAYRALWIFLRSTRLRLDPLMASLGYDPNNLTINTDTPGGDWNVACAAARVSTWRRFKPARRSAPRAYSDWTGYLSVIPASTVPVNQHWCSILTIGSH